MTDRRAVRVGVTCVGGRFVFDALQALRAAPDLDVTIIGMDAVAESSGKLFVDRFVQVPFASQDPRGLVNFLQGSVKELFRMLIKRIIHIYLRFKNNIFNPTACFSN